MGLNYIEEILCAKDRDSSICTEFTIENLLTLLFLRNGHPDPGAGPDGSVPSVFETTRLRTNVRPTTFSLNRHLDKLSEQFA